VKIINEVPLAITAFTEDAIERNGIGDINDVAKSVPSSTITKFIL
jgi:hypothetical protein